MDTDISEVGDTGRHVQKDRLMHGVRVVVRVASVGAEASDACVEEAGETIVTRKINTRMHGDYGYSRNRLGVRGPPESR